MADFLDSPPEEWPPIPEHWAPDPDDSPRPWGFRDLLVLIVVAVAGGVMSFGASQAGYRLIGPWLGWPEFSVEASQQSGPFLIATQTIWWVIVVAFLYALVTQRYGLSFAAAFRLQGRPDVLYFLPLGLLLAVTVAVIGGLLPMPDTETPFEELLDDRVSLAMIAVFGVLLAPALEEIIFRGFVFEPFEAKLGSPAAILITSAGFALMHGEQYDWRWQNLLLLTGVAAVFGLLRVRTRSLWPPILVHTGYNATLVGATLLASH